MPDVLRLWDIMALFGRKKPKNDDKEIICNEFLKRGLFIQCS